MVTSDFRPEVEIWSFRDCAMHPAITIVTVRSLWTWLCGRYHVPQIERISSYRNNLVQFFAPHGVYNERNSIEHD